MKKIILSILAIAPSFQGFAQTIEIDTSSNWQQWISGILGGNCVEISNVQFSNHPGSAARFTNAGDIGLNQGIVLSSGQISPIIDTSATYFLNGMFNDSEGDSLLEVYAVQEIGYTGNATSLDATRIEFDFVAPSDQTVNIRFVFASEEYPEFAPPNNSFFNDIFAFFVSAEGSGTYENIATVPGTNLPVTIGNINAITNAEYYIENTGDHFAFDAFTTPISATFQAIGGTTYHMIIAISDIGDFNFDSAVFLELNNNGSQSIHGTAYAGMEPLSAGQVDLFGFNTEPGAFDVLNSVSTDAAGD
ncbi:MAG: choice-of-anchor L domain-containing protein, partial [Bacteroidetes bacterium]|nr:choice-of-anchor L domain-containing protein [Bacteroidota bacterium]